VTAPDELQIQIDVGAGELVARQAPVALDPNAPENFSVQAPSGRSELQDDIQADVNIVFLILGAIALLAGGLGIANVTLLSVMERVGEIGLRRALGATRRNIAQQFMVESVVIGLLGGLIGAALRSGLRFLIRWLPSVRRYLVRSSVCSLVCIPR
jgi:putative ABC transport system permease protein